MCVIERDDEGNDDDEEYEGIDDDDEADEGIDDDEGDEIKSNQIVFAEHHRYYTFRYYTLQ